MVYTKNYKKVSDGNSVTGKGNRMMGVDRRGPG